MNTQRTPVPATVTTPLTETQKRQWCLTRRANLIEDDRSVPISKGDMAMSAACAVDSIARRLADPMRTPLHTEDREKLVQRISALTDILVDLAGEDADAE